MWRHAWGDGAHCPSTARLATYNGRIFVGSLSKTSNLKKLLRVKLAPPVSHHHAVNGSHNSTFGIGAAFVLNAEPRIGARPSVRVCVGLITTLILHTTTRSRVY